MVSKCSIDPYGPDQDLEMIEGVGRNTNVILYSVLINYSLKST